MTLGNTRSDAARGLASYPPWWGLASYPGCCVATTATGKNAQLTPVIDIRRFRSPWTRALHAFVLGAALVVLGTALVVGGLLPAPAHAQAEHAPGEPARPFSKISLYAGGNLTLDTGALGPYYRSSPGMEVSVATPFHAGVAALDVRLQRLEERAGRKRERLWAAPVVLRWGLRPSLAGAGRLRAEASAGLGTLFMRFSSNKPGIQNESELLMGADAGLSLRIGGRWQVTAGLRYERIFTSTSFHLWQVRAGVRRRFDAPRWFQTVFR